MLKIRFGYINTTIIENQPLYKQEFKPKFTYQQKNNGTNIFIDKISLNIQIKLLFQFEQVKKLFFKVFNNFTSNVMYMKQSLILEWTMFLK